MYLRILSLEYDSLYDRGLHAYGSTAPGGGMYAGGSLLTEQGRQLISIVPKHDPILSFFLSYRLVLFSNMRFN